MCDPTKTSFFADPTDCTGYYSCDEDNKARKLFCSPGKGFNSMQLSCNSLESSDCKKNK